MIQKSQFTEEKSGKNAIRKCKNLLLKFVFCKACFMCVWTDLP